MVDIAKLRDLKRRVFVGNLSKKIEEDNPPASPGASFASGEDQSVQRVQLSTILKGYKCISHEFRELISFIAE